MGAVLAKQRDWDVLLKTGRCLVDIGAKEDAANLRAALAGDLHSTPEHLHIGMQARFTLAWRCRR